MKWVCFFLGIMSFAMCAMQLTVAARETEVLRAMGFYSVAVLFGMMAIVECAVWMLLLEIDYRRDADAKAKEAHA